MRTGGPVRWGKREATGVDRKGMIWADGSYELWTSPFGDAFLERVGEVRHGLYIVSPYIRIEGVERVIGRLGANPRFPGLHVRILTRRDDAALVTSANLTGESLFGEGGFADVEYGVLLESPEAVDKVSSDLQGLWRTGTSVSTEFLRELAAMADSGGGAEGAPRRGGGP